MCFNSPFNAVWKHNLKKEDLWDFVPSKRKCMETLKAEYLCTVFVEPSVTIQTQSFSILFCEACVSITTVYRAIVFNTIMRVRVFLIASNCGLTSSVLKSLTGSKCSLAMIFQPLRLAMSFNDKRPFIPENHKITLYRKYFINQVILTDLLTETITMTTRAKIIKQTNETLQKQIANRSHLWRLTAQTESSYSVISILPGPDTESCRWGWAEQGKESWLVWMKRLGPLPPALAVECWSLRSRVEWI